MPTKVVGKVVFLRFVSAFSLVRKKKSDGIILTLSSPSEICDTSPEEPAVGVKNVEVPLPVDLKDIEDIEVPGLTTEGGLR